MKDTNYEAVSRILLASLKAIGRVKRIWADITSPEERAAAMLRFSGNDLIALAICELEKIGAFENPTSDQVWSANRWLDVLEEWVQEESRRCGGALVA